MPSSSSSRPGNLSLGGAPHVPPTITVSGVMQQVLLALVPAILAHAWYFGPGIFFQIALACGFALLFEWLMLRLRRRSFSATTAPW